MSFVGDVIGGLTGSTQAGAATRGGQQLSTAALEGADLRVAGGEAGLDAIRGRLDPFASMFGPERIESLTSLATDPTTQANFLQDNQLFDLLRGQARQDTFNTQSAGGALGGSGTDEILQNQFLSLGNDLINQQINRQLPIFQQAQSAAGNLGVNEANLLTDIGEFRAGGVEDSAQSLASGRIGAANARGKGASNILSAGVGIASLFSDERLKTNIEKIGSKNGINVYSWNWNDLAGDIGLTGKGVGHIAQQIQEVHPELVTEHANGFLMINYSTDKTVSVH